MGKIPVGQGSHCDSYRRDNRLKTIASVATEYLGAKTWGISTFWKSLKQGSPCT